MSGTSHEDRFKKTVMELADHLYEIISDIHNRGRTIVNPTLVKCGADFLDEFTGAQLVNNFSKRTHNFWNKIKNRDESFFDENINDIFGEIPMQHVTSFHKLFKIRNEVDDNGDKLISEEDQDLIWEFFDIIVKIAIKYLHDKQAPYVKIDGEGNKHNGYGKRFPFLKKNPDFDLQKEAEKWNVKITFE